MKVPILYSYAYARNSLDDFAKYADHPNINLMLDSGAFTAKNTGKEIRLEDYCRFLDKWKDKLFSYIALDVLNDPKASQDNLDVMIRAGYRPMGVHVFGDGEQRMDELFDQCDYVALGGLKRASGGPASKGYIKAVMSWVKGRRAHWLGYTNEAMFSLKPFSCDSSSWRSGVRFGSMRYYMGNGRWSPTVTYEKRHILLGTIGFIQRLKSLGYNTSQFNHREHWREISGKPSLLLDIPGDSYARYVIDIAKQFQVMYFLVQCPTGSSTSILELVERNI